MSLDARGACSPCTQTQGLPACRYPSIILAGLLYLGGWDAAEAQERLEELNIKR